MNHVLPIVNLYQCWFRCPIKAEDVDKPRIQTLI